MPSSHLSCTLEASMVLRHFTRSAIFLPILRLIHEVSKYKKRILELVYVSLEAISIILDIFGRNNKLAFLLASFLLSAFGVVMTLCSYFVIEQGNGSRLTVVEIVFAFSQLILTYIDLVMNILHVKTYYNYKASVFPFAFAIIVLVFAFKSNEEEEVLDVSDTNDPENRSPLRKIIEDQKPETTATQSNNGQLSIEKSMDDDGAQLFDVEGSMDEDGDDFLVIVEEDP